eukprot:comp24334_c8_seq1/m.46074 comp24334_c8_seq1/g.46074  ORF comp24334_c8_seq1/g.46074 comp24334_c8_seq1/m.46074 type:complete len:243 (-) comp24334_c8_seq1:639-1367(-)
MGSSSESSSWTEHFCQRRGNKYFCEVDGGYIEDTFNLFGLRPLVPNYAQALGLILDDEQVVYGSEDMSGEQVKQVAKCAERLYGLIHSRYIVTQKGLQRMYVKFGRGDFGVCPNKNCGYHLLPTGTTDVQKKGKLKLLCAQCEELFDLDGTAIDGAYFGTSFVQMFFFNYPELRPRRYPNKYVPKVFGFRVHPSGWTHRRDPLPIVRPHVGPPIAISSDSGTDMDGTLPANTGPVEVMEIED